MAKQDYTFYNSIAQANVMPDGMLNGISYGDFALLMVAKDRPEEPKKVHAKQNDNSADIKSWY